jgi:lipopolysaccharide transport system ATP-binding protein
MKDVILRVENLGKMYHIGAVQERHTTLIGAMANAADTAFRRIISPRAARIGTKNLEELWALRDISFELRRGEVLGIIGPNGSGKSTLLKILSRITAPTEGRIEINGNIGSLLEVGIGFHPELTGRENVYLSGAILGMQRGEITRVFDEIVDFSGMERFIDTPVKHYSSGMYMRLAFSVAAFFSPDILILDEVLAVGDADFQKKSLDKMERLAKSGKTVLFVSHALTSISRLCDRGLYLENGTIIFSGPALDTVSCYLKKIHKIDERRMQNEQMTAYMDLRHSDKRWEGYTKEILTWVSTHRMDGTPCAEFRTGEGIRIRIGYHHDKELQAYCNVNFLNYTGLAVMTVGLHHDKPRLKLVGEGFLECVIPELRLVSGKYILMLSIGYHALTDKRSCLDSISDTIHIEVKIGDYLGGYEVSPSESAFVQRSEWNVTCSES